MGYSDLYPPQSTYNMHDVIIHMLHVCTPLYCFKVLLDFYEWLMIVLERADLVQKESLMGWSLKSLVCTKVKICFHCWYFLYSQCWNMLDIMQHQPEWRKDAHYSVGDIFGWLHGQGIQSEGCNAATLWWSKNREAMEKDIKDWRWAAHCQKYTRYYSRFERNKLLMPRIARLPPSAASVPGFFSHASKQSPTEQFWQRGLQAALNVLQYIHVVRDAMSVNDWIAPAQGTEQKSVMRWFSDSQAKVRMNCNAVPFTLK